MMSYKVYYINLDKSKDRKKYMENQFKKLNIPITRIPAVYGKELDRKILKKETTRNAINAIKVSINSLLITSFSLLMSY